MGRAAKGDTTGDRTRARQERMQSQARGLRTTSSPKAVGFQTPEWLERSFVLPLTRPEVTDVPNQSLPDHDNFAEPNLHDRPGAETAAEPTPGFERPPSRDVDFARVIKRADRRRAATRMAAASTAVACLAVMAFLLTGSPLFLSLVVLGAAGMLAGLVVSLSLSSASIPHMKR